MTIGTCEKEACLCGTQWTKEKVEQFSDYPFEKEYKLAKDNIRFPVRYCDTGQQIFDLDNNLILDVRGWGRLEKKENGLQIQDNIGEFIARAINQKYYNKFKFDIRKIQEDCFAITTEKGFDLSQTQLQLLLVADEAFEAMQEVEEPTNGDMELLRSYQLAMGLKMNLDKIRKCKNYYPENTKIQNKKAFAEELADVVIRVMSIAGYNNIDISEEIINKMEKNKNRPYLHGKER